MPAQGRLPLSDPCEEAGDGVLCDGNDKAYECEGGISRRILDCSTQEQVCVAGQGCLACKPERVQCEENVRVRCLGDGSSYEELERCEGGDRCTVTGCRNLCDEAAEERSYIGCEYWPVTTMNSSLNGAFRPAVAVGNPSQHRAHVTLERGDERMEVEVASGDVEILPLTFVRELKSPYALELQDGGDGPPVVARGEPHSVLARGGGYRLTSDVPVTVHQFNPLRYRAEDCEGQANLGCYSFTNDASLLLPTSALTGAYMAVTRPTFAILGERSTQHSAFIAIVGTQDEPTEVEVRVTAHAAASAAGASDALSAMAPGDVLHVTLGAGDVLQLASAAVPESCPGETRTDRRAEGELVYCDPGPLYDLSGTEIEASAPVSVLAGHDCTFVPFDQWACDHLEETMLPIQAWGNEVIVTAPRLDDVADFHRVKVLSSVDGNRVTLESAELSEQEVVLGRGDSREWSLRGHLVVRADSPISVAQFLVGQEEAMALGDPSMTIAIPSVQFKDHYTLLTPGTYQATYANIVAPLGAEVRLNQGVVSGFTPIGDTGFGVARQRLKGRLYTLNSSAYVGVVLYGFGQFTSYMVPGGLDIREIQPAPF